MYGLPADFDGKFLIGRNLESICFNANQINLYFDDHVSITIEGAFSYRQEQTDGHQNLIKLPVLESNLMGLLEHAISGIVDDKNGDLTLKFDNSHVLKLFDTPDFEAYQIKYGENVIIV